jgi:regulator of sigma E protease
MISSILILAVAFLSLIALMIIHEFGHFIIAKKFGVKVEEFGIGYPPRIFGKKFGETIYSINWLPLGAFVRIYGEEGGVDDYRSFIGLKIWKRVLIVLGGVVAFWIAAIIIFSVMFAIGADLPIGDQDVAGLTSSQVRIVAISSDSPAEQAGLKTGDIILKLTSPNDAKSGPDTLNINKIKEFQDFTKNHAGKTINIEINRNGKVSELHLAVRAVAPEGQGLVGVGLERMGTLIKKSAWYMAPINGAVYTWNATIGVLQGFYQMFSNLFMAKGLPQGSEFAGPLGITVFLANAISYGPGFFLYFIGMISVCLAIFNLFPIPALDGGKLIFLLIEKIKGKPVSAKVESAITTVCFFILITLSIFVTVKFDIPRIADYFKSSLQK